MIGLFELGNRLRISTRAGSHVVYVLPTDRDSVFFARDLVDAFKRIGWKAKRDVSMIDIPNGLSVWPHDDVARAICNALMMATYAIGIGHKD